MLTVLVCARCVSCFPIKIIAAGDLTATCGNAYEIEKFTYFFTGASSRALTSSFQKGSAAGM